MCDPVSLGYAVAAVGAVGAYQQQQSASKAADAQDKANQTATAAATAAATKQASDADQANNRANSKSPDVAGLGSANAQAAKGGQSGTLLTGAQGVDPKTLLLGRTTLLGA